MMLRGQLALITGGSSGIGAATAKVFVQHGAKVVIVGRNEARLAAVAESLDNANYIVGDITEDGALPNVVSSAVDTLGGLTSLVNCAGVLGGGAMGTPACNLANFDFNFNVNVRAAFEAMTLCIPFLQAADGQSSIVNVSSVNGLQSFAGTAAYCASKAALDQLAKCAAVDLAGSGVRVNNVNPGVVVTELQKTGGMGQTDYEAFLDRSKEVTHPLAASRQLCQPEEVGELIAFLASDRAGFITGECIAIDGGRQCLGAR